MVSMSRILSRLALLTLFAACGAQAQAPKLVTAGVLAYGTAATYPPFQFTDGGAIVGFSVDHGEAIAKKLGLKTQVMNFDFPGLIPALQAGRFDIINSAMRITDERRGQVDFIPYMRIGTNLIVRAGNPKKVNGRADVCGLTIATELGTTVETYAREDSKRCTDAGKPAATVLTFPGRNDATIAVRQGRADVFYDTTPAAARAVQLAPDVFAIVGETFGFTENGIAVRKGDTAMKAAIDKAQAELVADGSYAALLKKWGFPPEVSIYK